MLRWSKIRADAARAHIEHCILKRDMTAGRQSTAVGGEERFAEGKTIYCAQTMVVFVPRKG